MDGVNHPSHYQTHKYECIDEMVAVFGKETVFDFCICNAWKYRYRAGSKGNYEEDMEKADWYIDKAIQLKEGNREAPYDYLIPTTSKMREMKVDKS